MSSSTSDQPIIRKEIHTYEAPWTTYSMAWCRRPDTKFRMGVGSFKEEYSNQIQIVQLNKDEFTGNCDFQKLCEFDHPYPPTKLMFAPPSHYTSNVSANSQQKDLLATTGDYLRLWNIDSENRVEMKAILNNNKHTGKFSTIKISIRFD